MVRREGCTGTVYKNDRVSCTHGRDNIEFSPGDDNCATSIETDELEVRGGKRRLDGIHHVESRDCTSGGVRVGTIGDSGSCNCTSGCSQVDSDRDLEV
jgi:hypothetical protein